MKNALNHLSERKQGHITTLLHIVHGELYRMVNASTLDEKTVNVFYRGCYLEAIPKARR
jgi:hypothetical protein